MTFTSINETAGNGMVVHGEVELLERGKKQWRASVRVNYAPVFMSHHYTRQAAEKELAKMHKCYMEVHRKCA